MHVSLFQFQYGRVLQYVQESSDQLPSSLTGSNSSGSFITVPDLSASLSARPLVTDHKIEFFMDQHLGRYFVEYVALVKSYFAMKSDK